MCLILIFSPFFLPEPESFSSLPLAPLPPAFASAPLFLAILTLFERSCSKCHRVGTVRRWRGEDPGETPLAKTLAPALLRQAAGGSCSPAVVNDVAVTQGSFTQASYSDCYTIWKMLRFGAARNMDNIHIKQT